MTILTNAIGCMLLLCCTVSWAVAATPPDWNEQQIEWHEYQDGLARAEASGKPVMLIFYADWCPTCHAYRDVFNRPQIVALAQQLVMIRVNVDQFPELSEQYGDDGSYVPRTFVLDSSGKRQQLLFPQKRYRYFIKATDLTAFEQLMSKALEGHD